MKSVEMIYCKNYVSLSIKINLSKNLGGQETIWMLLVCSYKGGGNKEITGPWGHKRPNVSLFIMECIQFVIL